MKKVIMELLDMKIWGDKVEDTLAYRLESRPIRTDDAILRWFHEDGTYTDVELNELIRVYEESQKLT